MTIAVAALGASAPVSLRIHGPTGKAVPSFIAWLRQLRRSAWILIACCCVFRIGDALLNDAVVPTGGSAAVAAGPL